MPNPIRTALGATRDEILPHVEASPHRVGGAFDNPEPAGEATPGATTTGTADTSAAESATYQPRLVVTYDGGLLVLDADDPGYGCSTRNGGQIVHRRHYYNVPVLNGALPADRNQIPGLQPTSLHLQLDPPGGGTGTVVSVPEDGSAPGFAQLRAAVEAVLQDEPGTLAGIADLSLPGCYGMTELGHGSDVASIATTAIYLRCVELHERGVATDEAVRLGLQRSGRIITSAALLMIIVFSGFVTAQVLAVKETGVALVLAIVIDATLVRMLLVPATMSVLGEWNWWAPRWMRALHARYGITE